MSEDQRKTALRVANIPEDEFEAAVESDNPPTMTDLARRGRQFSLGGTGRYGPRRTGMTSSPFDDKRLRSR